MILVYAGLPKCGSTAIAEYLKSSGQAYVPRSKELFYLSGLGERVEVEPYRTFYHRLNIPRTFSDYLGAIGVSPSKHSVLSDFSTDNLFAFEKFRERLSQLSSLDEVVCLMGYRNSVDCLVSRYTHNWLRGWETRPLEQAYLESGDLSEGAPFDFRYRDLVTICDSFHSYAEEIAKSYRVVEYNLDEVDLPFVLESLGFSVPVSGIGEANSRRTNFSKLSRFLSGHSVVKRALVKAIGERGSRYYPRVKRNVIAVAQALGLDREIPMLDRGELRLRAERLING